jgi:ornithine carbamoyltransferase
MAISEEAGTANQILITNSPAEALKDADYVVTDTWYVREELKYLVW